MHPDLPHDLLQAGGPRDGVCQLLVGYRDPRTINPFIMGRGDEALLQTIADDKPDCMTESGTLLASFGNTLPAPATISFSVLAFGGAYTRPVPEPGTATLLLFGLAPLLRRLRLNSSPRPPAGQDWVARASHVLPRSVHALNGGAGAGSVSMAGMTAWCRPRGLTGRCCPRPQSRLAG
jgi:hypothetical protein